MQLKKTAKVKKFSTASHICCLSGAVRHKQGRRSA